MRVRFTVIVTSLASAAILASAAARLLAFATDERSSGIDLWHVRATRKALAAGIPDVYTASGRASVFRSAVVPVLAPLADARGIVDGDALRTDGRLTREARAALATAQLDGPYLGYEGVETVATPALFALLAPFDTDDFGADHRRFVTMSIALLLGSVLLLLRWTGWGWRASASLAGLVGLSCAPARSDLAVANVNALLLAVVAVALWLARSRRDGAGVLTGIVLGLAACFKPTVALVPAALLFAWVSDGERRRAGWTLLGLVLGCAVALGATAVAWRGVLDGLHAWRSWSAAAGELAGTRRTVVDGNYAAARLLFEAWGLDSSATVALVLAAAGAVAIRATRPPGDRDRDRYRPDLRLGALTGLALVTTLLASSLAWAHYYVLALPLAICCLAPGLRRSRRVAWLPRLAAVASLVLLSQLPGSLGAGARGVAICHVAAALLLLVAGVLFIAMATARSGSPGGRRAYGTIPAGPA